MTITMRCLPHQITQIMRTDKPTVLFAPSYNADPYHIRSISMDCASIGKAIEKSIDSDRKIDRFSDVRNEYPCVFYKR